MNVGDPAVSAALIAASAALGAAFFAFIAALISASVTRRNAILSAQIAQRTKRAEFRQAWINQLRDSFVKFHGGVLSQSGLDVDRAQEALRILLLVNRNDPDFERLRLTILELKKKKDLTSDRFASAQRDYIVVAQDILKREWAVVKTEINKFEDDARKV